MGEFISFAQRSETPLKAGNYQLKVTPKTDIDCVLESESKDFVVATERFSLDSDQIYSVYPPREAVGNYNECLPHIVLKRRTLPWERTVCKNNANTPWITLLVFDHTERVDMNESTCLEVLTPKQGVLIPSIKLLPHENPDMPCHYIDIPVEVLSDILPYHQALSYLSHSKGVSLDNKVTDPSVSDYWFSTVVTNRFCLEPEDEQETISHTACLVSLEGFESLIQDKDIRTKTLSDYSYVRMIVLTSWNFHMCKASFDFASNFLRLDTGMLCTPYVKSEQDDNVKDEEIDEAELIRNLCNLGYFPMNHNIRDGSQLVSWYQSPLIPYEEVTKATNCVHFADQLLNYDPEIGMMDIRYASAWQLGKSLALADRSFAHKLFLWRQHHKLIVKNTLYQRLLYESLSDDGAQHNSINTMDAFEQQYLLTQLNRETVQSKNDEVQQQLNKRYKSILMEVLNNSATS